MFQVIVPSGAKEDVICGSKLLNGSLMVDQKKIVFTVQKIQKSKSLSIQYGKDKEMWEFDDTIK